MGVPYEGLPRLATLSFVPFPHTDSVTHSFIDSQRYVSHVKPGDQKSKPRAVFLEVDQ